MLKIMGLENIFNFTLKSFVDLNLLNMLLFYLFLVFLQLDGQVVAMLVQNLERLDENVKEEADGVHNTLGMSRS